MLFRREWEPAEGTIIDVWYPGADGTTSVNIFHILVDVRPRSGESFWAVIEPPPFMPSFAFPAAGQLVRMWYDPVRKKARFDRHDPAMRGKGGGRHASAGRALGREPHEVGV